MIDAGTIYTYSAGNKQHLYVNHPDLVKEMNYSMSWDLGKPSYVTKELAPMLGNGALRSNGHRYSRERLLHLNSSWTRLRYMSTVDLDTTDKYSMVFN